MAEAPRFMRYRYLLGAMQQMQTAMAVRTLCIAGEVDRLPEILDRWRRASIRMQELARTDAAALTQVSVHDPPPALRARITEIQADALFQASFSLVPSEVKLVSIDNLVAPQRDVNLDYAAELQTRLAGYSGSELVEFCLAPRAVPPPIQDMQTAQNQITFTSPSLDLRFLGGFPKAITEDDIRADYFGGQPARVVTLLVGLGAAPINVWSAAGRLILNNGFHRTFALRSAGITEMPVVVQHAANPDIEFPDQILGLSRAYLLHNPRPVVVKDFFDEALTVELRLKRRVKTVRVAWGNEDGIVPTE
jgi:hypothetical protein